MKASKGLPQLKIGDSFPFTDVVFCPKCGCKMELFHSFCEFNLENWQCSNAICRVVCEFRIGYERDKKGELQPVSMQLEKTW